MPSDLVSIIKAKQGEIAKLQAELDEALALLAAGRADGSGRVMPRVPAAPSKDPHRVRMRSVDPRGPETLPPDSAAAWAAQEIRAAGRPLHANQLVKAIEQAGHKVKLSTLVGSMSRWVAKKAVFYRAGKNVFGLIEMRKK